jgi:hypothetical protein
MVKICNIKFQENPSDANRVVQCRETEGRTANITNLTAGFRSFLRTSLRATAAIANAPAGIETDTYRNKISTIKSTSTSSGLICFNIASENINVSVVSN